MMPLGCLSKRLLLLLLVAACLSQQLLCRQFSTGRSLVTAQSNIAPHIYDRYDGYVTPWHELGVTHHMAVGKWAGQAYQISIWLRFPCSADSSKREVRLVVALNRAPARKYWWGYLEVVPKSFLVDGKLPGISFKSMNDRGSAPVDANITYWDGLIKQEIRTSVLVGHATLESGTFYRMEVEGCERVFHIPPTPCSSAKTNFGDDSAWLTLGGRAWNDGPPSTYAFLVVQYVAHHMRLGFAGLALVVTPHVATGLLANDEFAHMVKQRHIVLLTWDFSIDPSKEISIQIPSQNLVSMAMHGSRNVIGVWDVDEYLMLPGHKPIMHEVRQGCLKDVMEKEEEAVIPFEHATIDGWRGRAGEISVWLEHGSFREAAKHVKYTTQTYSHCNDGNICKALVDPNTDLIVQIHQLVQRPSKDVNRKPMPRSCAHMLHFYQLWAVRPFRKGGDNFLGPRVAFNTNDLPHAGDLPQSVTGHFLTYE